jgi:hypothetical protein
MQTTELDVIKAIPSFPVDAIVLTKRPAPVAPAGFDHYFQEAEHALVTVKTVLANLI